ncbi:unnamed protein product, partial [Coregonus sp. 'balchen']
MGRLNFFVLWSLHDTPRQFISKSNRQCHQVHVPLPLPKQLVVFSLGEWRFLSSETTISVDVLVSQEVKPQRIGTLSAQTREIGMLTLSKRQQRKGGEEYMGRFCSLFVERYGFQRVILYIFNIVIVTGVT